MYVYQSKKTMDFIKCYYSDIIKEKKKDLIKAIVT